MIPGCVTDPIPEPVISDGRYAMGTVLEIALEGLDPQSAARALAEFYDEALRLDRLLSIYDPESEISRINRTAGRGKEHVDPAVVEILRLSIAYSELTRGAFDVTVGPLVDLWMEAADRNAPPTAAELTAARQRVGAGRISANSADECFPRQRGDEARSRRDREGLRARPDAPAARTVRDRECAAQFRPEQHVGGGRTCGQRGLAAAGSRARGAIRGTDYAARPSALGLGKPAASGSK